jgi:asparaginyl-tRNA synthetase
MKRVEIGTVLETSQAGDKLTVAGWIKSIRGSKNLSFIAINDGSHFDSLQIILEPTLENFEEVTALLTGASITVEGEIRESEGKGQRVEMVPIKVEIVGECDPSSPIQKSRASFEFLRTVGHMRTRTNTFGAVFRMRSELSFAVHSFFNQRGFYYAQTPILTTSDCEGAGEVFQVTTFDMEKDLPKTEKGELDYSKDFFGQRCGLTVSGQLEAEVLAQSLGKVYTFGPTFRAENSNTTRHAAEFWMIEPEIAFADLQDDIKLAEDFVKHLIQHAFDKCGRDLDFFDQRIQKGLKQKLEAILKADFAVMDYTEAVNVLQKKAKKAKFQFVPEWGSDLHTEHERFLTEKINKKPTFVINYPKCIKPFYMYCNDDDKTVAAFDLLVPRVGELIGGSQREHRLDVLESRMKEQDMSLEGYKWYTDLRRFGTTPHAGFGLGFERALMYITGMENIRDVTLCPRTPGNASF